MFNFWQKWSTVESKEILLGKHRKQLDKEKVRVTWEIKTLHYKRGNERIRLETLLWMPGWRSVLLYIPSGIPPNFVKQSTETAWGNEAVYHIYSLWGLQGYNIYPTPICQMSSWPEVSESSRKMQMSELSRKMQVQKIQFPSSYNKQDRPSHASAI